MKIDVLPLLQSAESKKLDIARRCYAKLIRNDASMINISINAVLWNF